MTESRDIGSEILHGIRELKQGKAGRVLNVPPVAEVRQKTGLSQSKFATLLGVSVRTLQDWVRSTLLSFFSPSGVISKAQVKTTASGSPIASTSMMTWNTHCYPK